MARARSEAPCRKPPRLLGWRSLLFALVCGLGLAVLSVIVSAMGPWTAGVRARPPTPGKQWYWFEPEHTILYTERGALGLSIAGYSMVPVPSGHEVFFAGSVGSLEHSDIDRRPAWAIAPFGGHNEVVLAVASGWPWHAASGQDRWLQAPGLPGTHMTVARFEIGGEQFRIPLVPSWRGLLANTLFYAPFVLCVLLLLNLHRRARRRRKDRCVACNYDLSGIAGPCPECGCVDVGRVGRAFGGEG